jgi:acetolactate synthase-1/2/3 large subunit
VRPDHGIGARWDDRITGKLDEFCTGAVKIHVDIDPSEFDKIVQPDVSILGDARLVIEDLIPLIEMAQTEAWLAQCARWRKQYPLHYPKKGGLRAQHVLDRLDAITRATRSSPPTWASTRCGRRSSASRAEPPLDLERRRGTMGFGWPAAIGAAFANPRKKVWAWSATAASR